MVENQPTKISIITVCYNEPAENVRLTFGSISSQTYADKEWIVIDGGSRPETIEAISVFSAKIDKYISEPDDGIYDAMNKGLQLATGDFVVFMNVGDSFYSSETIEQVVRCILAEPGYDCYHGDVMRIDNKKNCSRVARTMPKPTRFLLLSEGICHQSIFSARQLYERTGFFDVGYKVMADWDWVHRSMAAGSRWKHIDVIVCRFDVNGVSGDTANLRADYRAISRKRYSLCERICYRAGWGLIRRYGLLLDKLHLRSKGQD